MMAALVGCTKEAPSEASSTQVDLRSIDEAYQPDQEEALHRIRHFAERKKAIMNGAKADGPDIPLSQAVWLSEADLNFEKADASVLIETLKLDSFFTVVPVQSDGAGNYVVKETDLILAHAALESQFGTMDQLKFVDVDLKDLGTDGALFRALAFKQDGVPELAPLPTGCFNIVDAVGVMNAYIPRMMIEPQGTIYVTVSAWKSLDVYQQHGILNGYTTYLGSDASFGVSEFLASGAISKQICFPDYWDEHLQLKQWYMSQTPPLAGKRMILGKYWLDYDVLTGSPMSYGSPYYPMGPYNHYYTFYHGLAICCGNSNSNGN